MDYEKAYKALVAKVKNAHLYAQTDSTKNVLENILPELTESEDERIRKDIIALIKFALEDGSAVSPGSHTTKEEAIAYLEKQKPAEWSEEEYDYYDAIIAKLEVTQNDAMLTDEQMSFLKSMPERFNFPPKQEWSERDERMCQETIYWFERRCFPYATENENPARDCIAWLKSLRPQPSSQLSTNHIVWHNASEEKPTKLPIIHIWYHGNRVNAVTHEDTCLQAELDDINFQPDDKWAYVEDLLNVQPHWKPSEEQMKAILDAMIPATGNTLVYLNSLYEQLKAL